LSIIGVALWREIEARLNAWPALSQKAKGAASISCTFVRRARMPSRDHDSWLARIDHRIFERLRPLTLPTPHGWQSQDAFYLALPPLPGYCFSQKPIAGGWDRHGIAKA
jgi:hypothetical protein